MNSFSNSAAGLSPSQRSPGRDYDSSAEWANDDYATSPGDDPVCRRRQIWDHRRDAAGPALVTGPTIPNPLRHAARKAADGAGNDETESRITGNYFYPLNASRFHLIPGDSERLQPLIWKYLSTEILGTVASGILNNLQEVLEDGQYGDHHYDIAG